MQVAELTTAGVIRGNNEDCAAVDGHIAVDDRLAAFSLDETRHLLVVADGIGGHEAGEVASRMVVESLIRSAALIRDEETCIEMLKAAQVDLFAAMRADKSRVGMGTTVVGVVVERQQALWFNVGDSRIYLVRAGKLNQLSIDHTPQTLDEEGKRSHMLTQWLGGFDEEDEDQVYPAFGTLTLGAGDRLLLCSDGLTDELSDDQIAAILANENEPAGATRTLVDQVMALGAPDNVTVIVAKV